MSRNSFPLLGAIGTAVPSGVLTSANYEDIASRLCARVPREEALIRGVVRQSGVERRHCVLLNPDSPAAGIPFYEERLEGFPKSPATAERMEMYERHAGPLALEAAEDSLGKSNLNPEEFTHVIHVSCTGFYSPGVDFDLIRNLTLRNDIQRLQIGFMGCHGALNALQIASNIVSGNKKAKVICVCTELCTLHFQFGLKRDLLLPNTLFADGAAAWIVSSDKENFQQSAFQIRETRSAVFPDTEKDMGWRIGDSGFLMKLTSAVPDLIQKSIRKELNLLLGEKKESFGEFDFAIHPGGPRILEKIQLALELTDEQMEPSRTILREKGNMSSPTVIHVLDELQKAKENRPVAMMAFGPGLVCEMALLEPY